MTYDLVIVGGGSAGCVLANRLSADRGRTVLLLEAGPDYASLDELPADIADASRGPSSHGWGFTTEPDSYGTSVPLPRGKVIGGSSSINFCFAPRARPADHDAWVEAGNEGWGYDDLLPLYRAMESYAHGEDRWHGRSGPYTLSRGDDGDLSEIATAFVEAAAVVGYPLGDDVNAPTAKPGVQFAARSVINGVRQSTALTYLNPVRDRPNLEVRGDALVDHVEFEGTRATGVRLADGEVISARHVVLCAGAYESPAILMRSGIGPAEHLRSVGVEILVDAPGVGQNLMEHPAVPGRYAAKPATRTVGAMQLGLNAHSGDPDEVDYDLQLFPSGAVPAHFLAPTYEEPSDGHPTGWDIIYLASCVQPRSRGSVTLRSTDPTDAPVIRLGLYDDPRDAEKVAEAVRIGRRIARTGPLKDLLVREMWPGEDIADDDLEEWVKRHPNVFHHASGTARMGLAKDPASVVDTACAVHHVDGLSVVDASVFPHIPRVATNASTIVAAERAAQKLEERLG